MCGDLYSQTTKRLAGIALTLALCAMAFGWATSAAAQDRCKDVCWIDVKTGKPVRTAPLSGANLGGTHAAQMSDANATTAFNPATGQNFAKSADGSWVDVKTGRCVRTAPLSGANLGGTHAAQMSDANTTTAFNPATGQNFARVPCPSEAATQPTSPEVGMVIEPKIGGGLGGSSGTASYVSTGGQLPFSGDASPTTGQICGGATFYPGFGVGPARVGLDANFCSGSNTFGSGDTLFRIMRHGPGDVDLHASTNVIIDVLFKGEVPIGPSNNLFLSGGVGPTFRELNLTLTSNQSFFGGGVPSASNSSWQTGVGIGGGLATFVCPDCIAGNPLKVGVEGRAMAESW